MAGLTWGEAGLQRWSYLEAPDTEPITRPGWKFLNRDAYAAISYGKSATALLTLEKVIGEATLRQALRTYFMRYRFAHPSAEDFLRTVQEISRQDLRWYFDQAFYGTSVSGL